MDDPANKVSLTCDKCGATFTAFLRQMAQHNQKVVCPKCGQAHPQPPSTRPAAKSKL